MKFLKKNTYKNPKVSIVLVDWSVRESFHLCHYLSLQNSNRNDFEIIVIEYYSTISKAILPFTKEIDQWILLEMPNHICYHKHLMYNAGIILSRGDIVIICDSDAMVKKTFISTVINTFEKQPNIVLHLDQFRNLQEKYYPFNYPSFEEVIGDGCINNSNGKTKGIIDKNDPLHTRNYGACMCAKRDDLINIGGADEHISYLGHICGPYEMTFRLINLGLKEIWHEEEYLYHTWHPGQTGVGNLLGPHDGKHMSTTAIEALITGRIKPCVENEVIRQTRFSGLYFPENLDKKIINKRYLNEWYIDKTKDSIIYPFSRYFNSGLVKNYKGLRTENQSRQYYAYSRFKESGKEKTRTEYSVVERSNALKELLIQIDKDVPKKIVLINLFCKFFFLLWLSFGSLLKSPKTIVNVLKNTRKMKRDLKFTVRLKGFLSKLWALIASQSDFITELFFLTHNEKINFEKKEIVLLTDKRFTKYFIFILRIMQLLPKIKVVLLRNYKSFKMYLINNIVDQQNVVLILNSALFIKYYHLMSFYQMRSRSFIIDENRFKNDFQFCK